MSHRNARTTFQGRLLIVQRHRAGWPQAHIAKAMGISRKRRIVTLRRKECRGPDWIGAELGVPPRTVSRVLARHGAPRLCALDPLTGEVLRSSKSTAVRYERDRPGEGGVVSGAAGCPGPSYRRIRGAASAPPG